MLRQLLFWWSKTSSWSESFWSRYCPPGVWDIIEAANADEALSALTEHPEIRVLFTDVTMPGRLNGCDLAREVHARRPDVGLVVTSGKRLPYDCDIPTAGFSSRNPIRRGPSRRDFTDAGLIPAAPDEARRRSRRAGGVGLFSPVEIGMTGRHNHGGKSETGGDLRKIEVQPLTGAIGAEIRGVELAKPLDPETRREILAAFREHLVIYFPDQPLTDARHVEFARLFGEIITLPQIFSLPECRNCSW